MSELATPRLVSRAFDGAFRTSELAALLVRVGLYAQTGRLEVKQGTALRAFGLRRGRLVEIETTEDDEAFERAMLGLSDGVLERAQASARELDVPLQQVLRQNQLLEPAVLGQAERAHANRVIAGCLDGADAIAWLDRRHQPSPDATTDLALFGAVWSAVLTRWPPEQRAALACRLGAPGLQLVDGAQPFLQQLGGAVTLPRSNRPQELDAEQQALLGGLLMCGIIRPVG